MLFKVGLLAVLGLSLSSTEEIPLERYDDDLRRVLSEYLEEPAELPIETEELGTALEQLFGQKRSQTEADLDTELGEENEDSDEESDENIENIVRDLMTGDVDDLRVDLEVRMRKNKQLREYRNFVAQFEDFVQSQIDIESFKRKIRDELNESGTEFHCNICKKPFRMKRKVPKWWRRLIDVIPEIRTDACARC